ncbi:hypothetical protein BASA60_002437 [Batrachochytrium salamandrivorans]|nr:hypothetical protein BASA60_002437 [Batrachochytrium salamandrivorans]
MKFNALVVAAMVITSVNAGGRGGFKSFLDKVGRMMRSGSSYGTLKNDLETEPSQNPPVNEPRPRPPRNSPRQVPDLYEILRKERHKEFNNLIKLIELTEGEFEKIEDDEDKVEDDEGADDGLIAEKVHIWMGSNLGAISDLESIKAEYDSLEEEYRESWKVLNDNNCMAELFKYLSPDHMVKLGYLPKWRHEIDLMRFDKQ